uniref:Uncharacterized protein n=1 Tax=Heterorhabditis bacteriophora TaxID=37862 RepID=A0A1I7X291_HETBA
MIMLNFIFFHDSPLLMNLLLDTKDCSF